MKCRFLPIALATALLLSGCSNGDINSETTNNGTPADTDFSQTADDMFSDRDTQDSYDANAIAIKLNTSSASCDSDKVQIDGGKITITDEGTYILSGTIDDGMVIINAEESDKIQLVLSNANITDVSGAALYILQADKVFVTMAKGSVNTMTNGGSYVAIDDNNIDAVIFSKQDLTFNGDGTLTISAPTEHGIVCKDDLVFTGGTYSITSASHGIDVNDSVRISGGSFTIDSGKDAIHVENSDNAEKGFVYINGGTFQIEAEGDGIDAGYYVQIEGGDFTMTCGGGYKNGSQSSSGGWGDWGGGNRPGRPGGRSTGTTGSSTTTAATSTDDSTSMKGIKANSSVLINSGTFTIDSADDGLHSNLSVFVNGGTFTIASGDDGIHGEEDLTITGGSIDITQSYEGLEALNVKVTGGDIKIQANDDGINAAGGNDSSGEGGRDNMFGGGRPGMGGGMSSGNGTIVISGGSIFMYAKGDGIDANGTLEITGGTTIVIGPTSGDTAILDYDKSASITGGTFIGVGSRNMAQSFSSNTQGVIALQATGSGGAQIKIDSATGENLIDYTPETSFNCIIISSPKLKTGDSYNITVGTQSGTFEAD